MDAYSKSCGMVLSFEKKEPGGRALSLVPKKWKNQLWLETVVLKKIKKLVQEPTLNCHFFASSLRNLKGSSNPFYKNPKIRMLKCFQEPRTGVSLILKFLKKPKTKVIAKSKNCPTLVLTTDPHNPIIQHKGHFEKFLQKMYMDIYIYS